MTTNPAARDSRSEMRLAHKSPFRLEDQDARANAAAEMLIKRGQELKVLESVVVK